MKKMLFPVNQDDFSAAVIASVNYLETSLIYDATPHGISINIDEKFKDATVKYGYSKDACSETKSPVLTNVKDSPLDIFYVVYCKDYEDINGKVTLEMCAFDFNNMEYISVPQQIYCASELKPTPNIYIGKNLLKIDRDYTIHYENNIEVGTATILITSTKADGNHYGSKIVQFIINRAEPQISIAQLYTIDIDNPDFQFPNQNTAVGVNGVSINGTLQWFTSDTLSTKAMFENLPRKAGEKITLYYQFTPSNHYQNNYAFVSGSAEFVVIDQNSSSNNGQEEALSPNESQTPVTNKQEENSHSSEPPHNSGGELY